MQHDVLYKLFITQLHDNHQASEKASEFIHRVARLYSLQIEKSGNSIPLHLLADVIEDIEAELIEMYRKKTYGFLSLEEYRKNYFSKTA